MTITPTYPGVYIQELPSSYHAVTAAPTSVAVFVGYINPFLPQNASGASSPNYGIPVLCSSFSDYQTNFGGLFSSPWQPDYLGKAVYQFFSNGGSTCYVVGLQATHYYPLVASTKTTPPSVGGSAGTVGAATLTFPEGSTPETITFTAIQPVGLGPDTTPSSTTQVGIRMTVSITPSTTTADSADIVITYGNVVETYRQVYINNLATTINGVSRLVTVSFSPASSPPSSPPSSAYPSISAENLTYPTIDAPPVPTSSSQYTVINPGVDSSFQDVFAANSPLDKVPVFNILCLPGIYDTTIIPLAVAFTERKRAFLILDPPPGSPSTTGTSTSGWDADTLVSTLAGGNSPHPTPPVSINAAIYFPWLSATDPVTGNPSSAPPSGFVAGMFATEDVNRGVWKAPAGIETSLLGTTGVVPTGVMTDAQQGVLNENGYNALRDFSGTGTVIYGARTTAFKTQQQWMYVPVRRMALFLEQSLYQSLTWAVFEPNAQPLWTSITQEVNAFMLSLFRQGAFAGTTPQTAFAVQCDATTTTAQDIANGIVNVLVAFAPLEPAEFVVVQIAQLAGQASS
jgi:hypothetical protein